MTAVEYLFETLWDCPKDKLTWYTILEKAKEMEKNQIIGAYQKGRFNYEDWDKGIKKNLVQSEQYYNEAYRSDESVKNFWVDDAKYQELIRPASSQLEISDEEIREQGIKYDNQALSETPIAHFMEGAFWYREQLKSKH